MESRIRPLFEGLCGQSQKDSNVLAVIKKAEEHHVLPLFYIAIYL